MRNRHWGRIASRIRPIPTRRFRMFYIVHWTILPDFRPFGRAHPRGDNWGQIGYTISLFWPRYDHSPNCDERADEHDRQEFHNKSLSHSGKNRICLTLANMDFLSCEGGPLPFCHRLDRSAEIGTGGLIVDLSLAPEMRGFAPASQLENHCYSTPNLRAFLRQRRWQQHLRQLGRCHFCQRQRRPT